MDRMTIPEKLDYTHRRLLSAVDSEQEMTIWNEFLVPLGRGETFPEMVKYFTTRLEDVVVKLRQLTVQNKPPGYLPRLETPHLWNALAWTLIERKIPQVGHDLLVAMYEFQLLQQNEMRRRLYKGFSLQNLGWANYLLGNVAAARKVVRLALLEEVFNTLEMDPNNQLRIVASNPAYLMLYQTLNCSQIELSNFISFARDYARQHPDRCSYPEDCYINYLRSIKAGVALHAVDDVEHITGFNHSYYNMLLDMLRRVSTMDGLDPCLADIASYLFNSVNDFTICDEAIPANTFNLIVRNELSSDPIIASLGNHIAVEWRYWMRELRSEELFALVSRLKLVGINTLVLFVRDSETSANLFDSLRLKTIIQRLYYQENIKVLIIKQVDLLDIERKSTNLLALMKLRLDGLKFANLEESDKKSKLDTKADSPIMLEIRPQPIASIINPMPPAQPAPMMQPPMAPPNMMPQNMPPNMMPQNMPPNVMPQSPMPPMMQPPMSPPNMMPQNMPPNMMPQNMPPMVSPQVPMTMSPSAVIPMSPPQMPPPNQPMAMVPLNPMLPMRQDNIGRMDMPGSVPARTPRLVIRNTGKPKSVEDSGIYYKPIVKPSFEVKPPSFEVKRSFEARPSFDVKPSFDSSSSSSNKSFDAQILKPCTSCQNQTSLSCKTCSKPFCNVHINVSSLQCDTCANPPKAEEESDNVSKLE
jgi:hypothetical protein